MYFEDALRALRDGKPIRRRGWPDGVYLFLVPGSEFTVGADRPMGQALPHLVGQQVRYRPHIDKIQDGVAEMWESTNAALLADDWLVQWPTTGLTRDS